MIRTHGFFVKKASLQYRVTKECTRKKTLDLGICFRYFSVLLQIDFPLQVLHHIGYLLTCKECIEVLPKCCAITFLSKTSQNVLWKDEVFENAKKLQLWFEWLSS